jgi:hypothetical protein
MKKILKILSFIWLFFIFLLHSYAFDANLSIDKNTANINDYINLKLEINSSEWGKIIVTNIKWLENFTKVWQSQSQSSSSQIVVINWKTQSKTTTTLNVNFTLKPLKNWEFEIWPAILKSGSWTIKTNSVKVKIDWTNIAIWNTNLWIQSNNNIQNINKQVQNNSQNINNLEKKEYINLDDYKNNNELYLLLTILILASIWFYFIIKNKENFTEKIKEENQEKFSENKEVDFEEKQKVIYPELNDPEFIKKAEKALRQVLANKYNIKNIDSLTFEEIQTKIWDKLDLKEIFDMINKAKYSNIITDYSKILEYIQKI